MVVFYDQKETLVIDNDTIECRILHREWNPIPSYTPPPGTIWLVEADNLPLAQTWCHGIGGTKEQAIVSFENTYKRIKKATDENKSKE